MRVDRLRGQGGAVGPDRVEQVGGGAQADAGGVEPGFQRLRSGQAQHLAVDRDDTAARHLFDQPVQVRG